MTKKFNFLLICLLICFGCTSANANNLTETDWLNITENSIPGIPVQKGVAGAITGIDGNALIVAGGSYFNSPLWKGGQKIYLDSIFICVKNENEYRW